MRRSWLIAAIVLGIVAIAGVAIVMRLTDDDSAQTSPAAWAESVCASLSTWRASITSLADVGGGALTPESLGDKLDEASTATETLLTELRQLGPPDLESGEALKEQLDSAASEIESGFAALKQGAEDAAGAGSPAEFLEALAALAPRFQALLDTLATTVDDLRSANVARDARGELQAAFADAPSCQELRSDS